MKKIGSLNQQCFTNSGARPGTFFLDVDCVMNLVLLLILLCHLSAFSQLQKFTSKNSFGVS